MKKVSLILIVMLLCMASKGFSQTTTTAATSAPATTDYFAGKWDILIVGTPNGDAKFIANLARKDGKLVGNLTTPGETKAEPIPITGVEEAADKISLSFNAQGYDLILVLNKVDNDNLKGSLINMFDATAKRIKE